MTDRRDAQKGSHRQAPAATIRLGVALSVAAVVVAAIASTIGQVSSTAIVAIVMVTGFTMSWIASGRTRPVPARVPTHRVTVVAARRAVGHAA